jgi:hypothetical protein
LAIVLWLGVSVLGAELTRPDPDAGLLTFLDPKAIWSSLRGWVSSDSPSEAAVGSGSRPSPSAAAGGKAPSKEVPKAPPPPPRVVAGLAPIARQSPAVHQGAQFALQSSLPSGFESHLVQDRMALAPEQAGVEERQPQRGLPNSSAADDVASPSEEAARVVPGVWTQRAAQGCEQAHATYQETLDMAAAPAAPDVSRQAFAERLEDFDAYARCDLDQPRDISICVAVQDGKAKGITVKTQPRDARLAACIVEAVGRMRFASSPRMDLVRSELTVR